MRRLMIIIAILVIVPIIELAVLIGIGQVIGGWQTLLLVLATSALGGWLLRRYGGRAWRAFQADVAEGRPPGNTATDGLLVLVGAMFMLVPGFISDLIGLFFILPPTRRMSRALVIRLAESRMSSAVTAPLFGPRTVRIRYGEPRHANPPGSSPPGSPGSSSPAGEIVEGEIIDPR